MSILAQCIVGIGDAENDQAFLRACGCAVAVANALPSVKVQADLVSSRSRRGRTIELARLLTDHDMRGLGLKVPRVQPVLGTRTDAAPICLSPFESDADYHGSSGSGKSTVVTAPLWADPRASPTSFASSTRKATTSNLPTPVVLGDAS